MIPVRKMPSNVPAPPIETTGAPQFGQRRSGGVQGRRRVQDRRNVGVIEIECMTRNSVNECRVGDSQPMGGAEHPGLRVAALRKALLPGYACGGFFGARDGEAEVIEQAPGALVQHVGGDVGGGGVTHEVEQRARLDGGPIVIAFGVWCHVVCITEFLSVKQTGICR